MFPAAQCRGVSSFPARASGSAPPSSSAAATAGSSLFPAAQCRGVSSFPARASGSAPPSSSAATTAGSSVNHAAPCRGVAPFQARASGSAPPSSSAATTARPSPSPAAACRGAKPFWSRASGSAPPSSSAATTAGLALSAAAVCSGVSLSSSRASGSAPPSSSAATTAGSSLNPAAQCRGVAPVSSRVFGSAPAARHVSTAGSAADRKNSGVFQPGQSAATAGTGARKQATAAAPTVPRHTAARVASGCRAGREDIASPAANGKAPAATGPRAHHRIIRMRSFNPVRSACQANSTRRDGQAPPAGSGEARRCPLPLPSCPRRRASTSLAPPSSLAAAPRAPSLGTGGTAGFSCGSASRSTHPPVMPRAGGASTCCFGCSCEGGRLSATGRAFAGLGRAASWP